MQRFTEQDYDKLSLHDNLVRGLSIRTEYEQDLADLVLDIDYIAGWVDSENEHKCLIAAADLTFHGVTGLKFSIDAHDDRFQVCIPGDWIRDIKRSPVIPQLVHLDRPYWRWDFEFSMDTQLTFGAYGFTLQLRQDPISHNAEYLPLALRG